MKLRHLSIAMLCSLSLTAKAAPAPVNATEPAETKALQTLQIQSAPSRVTLFGDSLSDIGNTQLLLKVFKGEADPSVLFKPTNADVQYSWVDKLFTYLGINPNDLPKIEGWMVKPLIKVINKLITVPIYPDLNYHQGRFSNGPVWNEWLAEMLGVPVHDPSRFINRAYGGSWATRIPDSPKIDWSSWETIKEGFENIIAGKVIPPGMTPLVKAYLDEYPPIAGKSWMQSGQVFISLYGGNDYMFGEDDPNKVVTRISEEITKLATYATKSATTDNPSWFIIGNLPDLSWVPRFRTGSQQKDAKKVSALMNQHNELLQKQINNWKAFYSPQNLKFELLDSYSLVKDELENGGYEVKDKPCYNQDIPGSQDYKDLPMRTLLDVKPCDNPDDYAFWDQIHPSRKMHARIAYKACEASFQKLGGHCWLPDYTNEKEYPRTTLNP